MPIPSRTSILLVARGLDPVGSGGQLMLAAAGLAAAGWDVHLATTSSGGDVSRRLAAVGIPVHAVGTRPVVDFAAAARLAALVRRLAPAVAVAWGGSQLPLAATVKLAVPRTRVAAHLAAVPRGSLAAVALRRLDRLLVSSPAVAAWCRGRGGPAVEVVPPGIAVVATPGLARADVAARLGLRVDAVWTVCVAPLVPASRLERLIWGIDQLGVVRKDVEHVLVGTGPLLDRVRRRAHVQQLAERLFVMPHCDVLPDLVGHARLVWQSGDVSLGGAILDAMAAGIPAVAVESDAARQLIEDGVTGRVVTALPESELPRRAFGLIEDDALAARYGAAARARAARDFPADRMVAAIAAAVSGLV